MVLPMRPMRNETAMRALVKAGWEGRNWYSDARAEIEYVCRAEGWEPERFVAILAVTSPRAQVRRNIRLALAWMFDGALPAGVLGMVEKACKRYDDTGEISGPKVTAFAANLNGNEDVITWDTHMINAFLGVEITKFRKAELAEAERILRVIAEDLDLTVAQVQAAIWAGWRALQGWSPSDFSVKEEWLRWHDERGPIEEAPF